MSKSPLGVLVKGGCSVSRRLTLAACCLLAGAVLAAPIPKGKEAGSPFIDLTSHANHKLKDDFNSSRYAGNNLASLPVGEQTFAGVKFKVGDGLMQLGSAQFKGK